MLNTAPATNGQTLPTDDVSHWGPIKRAPDRNPDLNTATLYWDIRNRRTNGLAGYHACAKIGKEWWIHYLRYLRFKADQAATEG